MIFFFKADGTLIKSAPETVYQGSAEAGKVYVVAPLNANMLVDVYYELPNGERWGAYLLENNGTVINNEELPDGWALWSTTLESAITQYAGTLKAQFGFYQSGKADKVPLITSQGVTITIAKGVVRDVFPDSPIPSVYEYLTSTISTIKQNFDNLPNEYLSNTNEDKIALKNNKAIEYSENATAETIAKRDSDGKINVADGTEDLNAVNVGQLNAALEKKVDGTSVSSAAVKDTIAQRTETGQLKAADGVADDDLATIKQLNAVQGNYTDITNIDLNTGDTTVEYDTGLGITVNAKGTVTHKNGNTEQPTTKFELPIIAGEGVSIDKEENEEKVEIKSLNSNLENGEAPGSVKMSKGNSSANGSLAFASGYYTKANSDSTYAGGFFAVADVEFSMSYGFSTQTQNEVLAAFGKYNNPTTGDIFEIGNGSADDRKNAFAVLTDGRAKVQTAPTEADDVVRKKELDAALTSVYTYKGSKDTYANLPATGNNVGDVWNVEDTGNNYAWNGTNWDSLSANVLDSTGNSTVQAMSQKATTDELNKKVNTSDNFVKAFTIPNGVSTGTLTSDVKAKLCNPDGHNYYVFDSTSEMILKYSFNSEDEIIQYKAVYFVNDKAYDITMQILPSNGSWRRSQTVLNGATANPTLTGTEAELTSLKVGGTDYKIPASLGGEAVTPSAATSTATSGTFTSAEWSKLQANDNNYILFNNEIYRLADKAHSGTTGIWSYTHTGWDGTAIMDKSINVTVSTGAWTLVMGQGSSSVQADYNQDDSTAADYIKNRPFYEGQSLTEVANFKVISGNLKEAGSTVTVEYNGERFTGTVTNDSTNYELIIGELGQGNFTCQIMIDSANTGTPTAVSIGYRKNYEIKVNDEVIFNGNKYLVKVVASGDVAGKLYISDGEVNFETFEHISASFVYIFETTSSGGMVLDVYEIFSNTTDINFNLKVYQSTIKTIDPKFLPSAKLYLHYIYFNNVVNTPTLIFYSTSLDKVTDKWIYDNLANKYSLTIFPTITSITAYGGIGLIRGIKQTSSSPSWGANTDLSSPNPTTLSVSDATSYIITEL